MNKGARNNSIEKSSRFRNTREVFILNLTVHGDPAGDNLIVDSGT